MKYNRTFKAFFSTTWSTLHDSLYSIHTHIRTLMAMAASAARQPIHQEHFRVKYVSTAGNSDHGSSD